MTLSIYKAVSRAGIRQYRQVGSTRLQRPSRARGYSVSDGKQSDRDCVVITRAGLRLVPVPLISAD